MAKYRQVQTSYWNDGFVLDLTPEEKYFYLYIMTNQKSSQCGIYELPMQIISIETGYNRETVDKLLKRFEEYEKIKYSLKTKEIIILNWPKYNPPNNVNAIKCINRELREVKNTTFVKDYYDALIDLRIDTRAVFNGLKLKFLNGKAPGEGNKNTQINDDEDDKDNDNKQMNVNWNNNLNENTQMNNNENNHQDDENIDEINIEDDKSITRTIKDGTYEENASEPQNKEMNSYSSEERVNSYEDVDINTKDKPHASDNEIIKDDFKNRINSYEESTSQTDSLKYTHCTNLSPFEGACQPLASKEVISNKQEIINNKQKRRSSSNNNYSDYNNKGVDITTDETAATTTSFQDIILNFEKNIHRICPIEENILAYWYKNMSADLINKAIEEAVLYDVKNIRYIDKILQHWYKCGVNQLIKLNGYKKKWENNKQKKKNNNGIPPWNGYIGEPDRYDLDSIEKTLLGWN